MERWQESVHFRPLVLSLVQVGSIAFLWNHPYLHLSTDAALGLAFVPLGTEGWRIERIKFVFNIYTGPGYLGGFLGVLNIVLLILLFRVRKLSTEQKPVEKKLKKVLTSEC